MSDMIIPDTWALTALSNIIEIKHGYAFEGEKFRNAGTQILLTPGNFKSEGGFRRQGEKTKFFVGKVDPEYILRPGDLLVAMTDLTQKPPGILGAPAFVPRDGNIYLHNQRLGLVKVKSNFSQDFLFWFFNSTSYRNTLAKTATGSTVRHTSPKRIYEISLPIPPIAEQKRIVTKIETTQEKIKTIEEIVSKAEELIGKYRESLLQKAFRGQLVPQDPNDEPASELLKRIRTERAQATDSKKKKKEDLPPISKDEIPFEIPKTWEWVRLGSILEVSSGENLTASKQLSGTIPVYGGNGIAGYHNKENLIQSHIVIGRVGAKCGSIHITPEKSWVTDNALIVEANPSCLDQQWLGLILRHLNLNSLSNSSAQPVISGTKIYQVMIPLPPKKEQVRIREILESKETTTQSFEDGIIQIAQASSRLQEAILSSAFSGQLVPQNISEGTGQELLEKIVNSTEINISNKKVDLKASKKSTNKKAAK